MALTRKYVPWLNKEYLKTLGPALLITIIGFWVAYQFVQPAPPATIVISTGSKDGAYYLFAQQYKEILARSGITLEIRTSAGSVENIELLEKREVDLAFVQGGTNRSRDPQNLVSLGSMYYEPLWVFYRSNRELKRLTDFEGKRIAVGKEGSGTRPVAIQLLKENRVTSAPTVLSSLSGQAAADALLRRDVDAAFFIASPRSPTIQKLVTKSQTKLMSFERAKAYTRRHAHLSSVILPQAVIDLDRNLPPHDATLLAVTANLVVRTDFHPALIDLLLQAATQVHGGKGLFDEQGEFPSPKHLEFPLSEEAERFYKRGPSFLRRYLPFWAATFVERMIVMLIPLVALLLPLFKVVQPTYRWMVRSKIYRWYRDLKEVDLGLQDEKSEERLEVYVAEIDRIEDEVNKIATPLPYADQLYNLRMHVNLVREKLEKAIKAAGPDTSL